MKKTIIQASIYFSLCFFFIAIAFLIPKSLEPIKNISVFVVILFFTERIYKYLNKL